MLSDCPNCWDTPCTCGYEWRTYTKPYRIRQAAVVLGIPEARLAELVASDIPDVHPMNKEP